MTDHDEDLTEDQQAHPERLLAGYVSGELSPGEASLVDRHLSSCATCREEVHLARRARTAVSTLPSLDVPAGLTRSVVDRGRAQRTRSPAWLWGTGAAAVTTAAAVVILFTVFHGGGGGGGVPTAARTGPEGAGGAAAPARNPAIHVSHENYDPAKIQALAGQLASRSFARTTSRNPAPAPQAGKAAELSSRNPLGCLRNAGAPVGKDTLVEIIAARFNGTPAYVAAFNHRPAPGEPPNLLTIWVSARTGCGLLHYASQPLGR
jgi:putative zinc finger protein